MWRNAGVDPMTEAVKEQLSACLDGELPRAELDLVLRRLGRDGQLQGVMSRYALVSEALKGERTAATSRDFAARVMAQIDAEPQVRRPGWKSVSTVLRPIAGLAVAAGVAALALLSVQRPGVEPAATVATTEIPAPAGALADPSYVVPQTTSSPAFVPAGAARLTNYVVAHSEYSSPLGRRSVLTGVLAEDEIGPEQDAVTQPAVSQPQER
jgi:sigma-E factor negative regulatory protein RseA